MTFKNQELNILDLTAMIEEYCRRARFWIQMEEPDLVYEYAKRLTHWGNIALDCGALGRGALNR